MTVDNKAKLQGILGDKYEVQDMIYRGGMGEIYLGLHKKLGAKVAIKIMIQKLTDDPELKKRFHREAQLYANLRHPNIIHIYDFGTEEAFDYMVFPFIDGETLQEKLKKVGKVEETECLNIMISVAKALAYASENNVIHRDVKPSNIMIERNGNVLIADFGISKNLQDIDITLPGTVLGSPKYMSPEQILGKEVDSRSDQYSLGFILYEMLAGKFPFEGNSASALFYSHVNETPELPEEIASQVHPEFQRIIKKMIAKDPSERYDSFKSLIEDLTYIQVEETQIKHRPHSVKSKKSGGASFAKFALISAAGILLVLGILGAVLFKAPEKITKPKLPPVAAQKEPAKTEEPAEPIQSASVEPQEEPSDIQPSIASIKNILFNFGQPDETALYQIGINKSSFKIGNMITYSIESKKDCHVVLLDFSTAGEMIQLFPNQFHPSTFIKANTSYKIPSQGSFEVTGPAGSETVIGYASASEFTLINGSFDSTPFLTITDKDKEALTGFYQNIQNLKKTKLVRKNIDFMISE